MTSLNSISATSHPVRAQTTEISSISISLNSIFNFCRDRLTSISNSFSSTFLSTPEHTYTVQTGTNAGRVENFDIFRLHVRRTELLPTERIAADIDSLRKMSGSSSIRDLQNFFTQLSPTTQNTLISALAHIYHKTDFIDKVEASFLQDPGAFINLGIPPVIHSSGGTLVNQIIHHLQLENSKHELIQSEIADIAPIERLIAAMDDPTKNNTDLLDLFDVLPSSARNKLYGLVYKICKGSIPSRFQGPKAGENYARSDISMLKRLIQPGKNVNLLENIKSNINIYRAEDLTIAENKQLLLARYNSNLYNHQELKQLWKTLPTYVRSEILTELGLSSTVDNVHFYGKGIQSDLYNHFGAHRMPNGDVVFRVFAPNAVKVDIDLIRPFAEGSKITASSGTKIPMTKNTTTGEWEFQARDIEDGCMYQYLITPRKGENPLRKSDPYAKQTMIGFLKGEYQQFSVVTHENFDWGHSEKTFLETRSIEADNPIKSTIYELHVTSWKKKDDGSNLNWVELANELARHCKELNYTHVELMGAMEHPSEKSWGYQISSYFSMNHRMGTLSEFKQFMQIMHRNDIHVIIDWVPGHFATDGFNTAMFDGSAIYEHSDPRRSQLNWGVFAHDFEKRYVRDYLISSATYLTQELHVDGLRIDACDVILHTNKCRKMDESKQPISLPHVKGRAAYDYKTEAGIQVTGHTHPDAKTFFRDLNCIIDKNPDKSNSGVVTYAEDSNNFPLITAPVSYKISERPDGSFNTRGLGIKFKWDMGGDWQRRNQYFSVPLFKRNLKSIINSLSIKDIDHPPVVIADNHDHYCHSKTKKFCSTRPNLSEEIAKSEKRSQFQLYQAFRYMSPGLKLNMMGVEFDQTEEWSARLKDSIESSEKNMPGKSAVKWSLLSNGSTYHPSVQNLFRDLNHLYLTHPALHGDNRAGSAIILHKNYDEHVIGFLRQYSSPDPRTNQVLFCVANFKWKDFPSYEIRFDRSIDTAPRISSFNPTPVFSLEKYYPRQQPDLKLNTTYREGRIYSVKMKIPPFSLQVYEARLT